MTPLGCKSLLQVSFFNNEQSRDCRAEKQHGHVRDKCLDINHPNLESSSVYNRGSTY